MMKPQICWKKEDVLENLKPQRGQTHLSIIGESPDQRGSVGWVSHRKAKDRRFNPWSGHTSGLLVWSPVRAQPIDASLSHQCFSPSLSPFLLLSLKTNKILKIKGEKINGIVKFLIDLTHKGTEICCS